MCVLFPCVLLSYYYLADIAVPCGSEEKRAKEQKLRLEAALRMRELYLEKQNPSPPAGGGGGGSGSMPPRNSFGFHTLGDPF